MGTTLLNVRYRRNEGVLRITFERRANMHSRATHELRIPVPAAAEHDVRAVLEQIRRTSEAPAQR